MRSGILFSEDRKGWFNATLFKKNITRFWPIWAGYAAITFFALPVELLTEVEPSYALANKVGTVSSVVRNAAVASVLLGLVFGLLTAMALFSYLMDHKAAQMLHALPIRREGLFLTNWLSGLWSFLVPNLAVFLVAAAIEGACGALALSELVMWLLTATAAPMFFFCFAACCAMFTGHILALPVFYGILNALVVGMCALLDEACDILLYNYGGAYLSGSNFARWCTPVWHFIELLDRETCLAASPVTTVVCYCLVMGAVFTSIAVIVYHLRELERAGDIVTVGWVRPVFQYGLGICAGLLLGLILYANFLYGLGPWAFILATAVCAVLGAFAGRMLLKKTLKVFAEGWKGCAALGLAAVLVMAGVYADFFGYQRWTPDPAQVVSVTVAGPYNYPSDDAWYASFTVKDPERVGQVVELHRALNDDLEALRNFDWDKETAPMEGRSDSGEDWVENMDTRAIRFTYVLADGSTVRRWYDPVPIRASDLSTLGSYAALLSDLLNHPAVVSDSYLRLLDETEEPQEMTASGGYISNTTGVVRTPERYYRYLDDVETARAEPVYFGDEVTLSAAEAQIIWEAFQADLAEGNARRYLLEDAARYENCYFSDIHLSLTWWAVDQETGQRQTRASDLTITPEKTETHLMDALEELGYLPLLQTWSDVRSDG